MLNALPGAGGGTRTIDGCLNNFGTINVSSAMSFSCASGNHQNYADIVIGSGGTLTMFGSGSAEHGTVSIAERGRTTCRIWIR